MTNEWIALNSAGYDQPASCVSAIQDPSVHTEGIVSSQWHHSSLWRGCKAFGFSSSPTLEHSKSCSRQWEAWSPKWTQSDQPTRELLKRSWLQNDVVEENLASGIHMNVLWPIKLQPVNPTTPTTPREYIIFFSRALLSGSISYGSWTYWGWFVDIEPGNAAGLLLKSLRCQLLSLGSLN